MPQHLSTGLLVNIGHESLIRELFISPAFLVFQAYLHMHIPRQDQHYYQKLNAAGNQINCRRDEIKCGTENPAVMEKLGQVTMYRDAASN